MIQVHFGDLSELERRTVFWNNDFARPDLYLSYLNESVEFDSNTNQFRVDTKSEENAYNRSLRTINQTRDGTLEIGAYVKLGPLRLKIGPRYHEKAREAEYGNNADQQTE